MRDWEKIVPEYDRQVYEKAGYTANNPSDRSRRC